MRVAASVDDATLESILNNQLLLGRLVASYAKGLEFQNGEVVRWYPTNDRRIVIDPERSFGQPIVAREGVPTLVLSKSFRVERSVSRVARWYDVEIDSVRSAIDFEKTRQAA